MSPAVKVGRGTAQSLAGELVLPVLLRRIELLPSAAVRPPVIDPLAASAWAKSCSLLWFRRACRWRTRPWRWRRTTLSGVMVDTTVLPTATAHPTDARLCHRDVEKLGIVQK
jgi:hypothetical protein